MTPKNKAFLTLCLLQTASCIHTSNSRPATPSAGDLTLAGTEQRSSLSPFDATAFNIPDISDTSDEERTTPARRAVSPTTHLQKAQTRSNNIAQALLDTYNPETKRGKKFAALSSTAQTVAINRLHEQGELANLMVTNLTLQQQLAALTAITARAATNQSPTKSSTTPPSPVAATNEESALNDRSATNSADEEQLRKSPKRVTSPTHEEFAPAPIQEVPADQRLKPTTPPAPAAATNEKSALNDRSATSNADEEQLRRSPKRVTSPTQAGQPVAPAPVNVDQSRVSPTRRPDSPAHEEFAPTPIQEVPVDQRLNPTTPPVPAATNEKSATPTFTHTQADVDTARQTAVAQANKTVWRWRLATVAALAVNSKWFTTNCYIPAMRACGIWLQKVGSTPPANK